MRSHCWAVAAALLALSGLIGEAEAGSENDDACRKAFTFLGSQSGDDPCYDLAGYVVLTIGDSRLADPVSSGGITTEVHARDLQQTNSGDAATGGSIAQGEAVPTAQPMAIGGGAVSVVGSDVGTDAITALTLNPAIFLTDPRSKESVAKWSRVTDFTVFFPVEEIDRDDDGDVDYLGLRVRVNMTGLSAGRQLLQRAEAGLRDIVKQENLKIAWVAEVLRKAPDVPGCVASLTAAGQDKPADPEKVCGTDAQVELDEGRYEEFRRRLAEAREEADSRYLGLDLRMDFGDPTLGAVASASGSSMTGGLAFGRAFGEGSSGATLGMKGRMGVRYTHLEELDKTSFALDGGLALETRRLIAEQTSVVAATGFEFRYGGSRRDAEMQTDFLTFRASISVPISSVTGLNLSVGAPLIGDGISPTLSMSANWKLLLPQIGLQ